MSDNEDDDQDEEVENANHDDNDEENGGGGGGDSNSGGGNNSGGGPQIAISDDNDSEANAETDEDAGMDTVCESCGCEEQEHDAHLCPVENCPGDKIICNVCEQTCGPCHAHNDDD